MRETPFYLAGPALLAAGQIEGLNLPEGALDPEEISDLDSFPGAEHAAGWLLISDDVSGDTLRDLLVRLSGTMDPWAPLLVRGIGDPEVPTELIPLSPGWPESPSKVSERLSTGGSAAGYLAFRGAMADLSKVRHDINNPLTAALAEVQLSLLDVEPDSELETSLKVVERQIRRIRDMVMELNHYRTPRSTARAGRPGSGAPTQGPGDATQDSGAATQDSGVATQGSGDTTENSGATALGSAPTTQDSGATMDSDASAPDSPGARSE